MAKNIGEALMLLNKMGTMNVEGMNLDNTNEVISHINHKYRDVVIVPYVAISDNITFLLNKGEKKVITADGFLCKVTKLKEYHICELEDKVRELYNIDCWSFIKRWYMTRKSMDSLHFIMLNLEKV